MKSSTKYYVDSHRIDEIFENAKLGRVSSIQSMEAGEFNSAYCVTADSIDHVIKIAPNSNEHLLTYEKKLMAREVDFYRIIQRNTTVKTPRIFYYDASKKLVESPYLIMEMLSSKPLTECRLDETEKEQVCSAVGEAVAKLHSIKSKKYGYEQNGLHDN